MNLEGQIGEVRMAVQITRKDTGKVEDYEVVGFVNAQQLKDLQHVNHPLDRSTQRRD
jgi:hypothetical protein